VVALSSGLRNFVGRGIELDGLASQLESVVTTARGFIAYLIQDGVTERDWDTIGESAEERMSVRLLESRRFNGLPVFAASLPAA